MLSIVAVSKVLKAPHTPTSVKSHPIWIPIPLGSTIISLSKRPQVQGPEPNLNLSPYCNYEGIEYVLIHYDLSHADMLTETDEGTYENTVLLSACVANNGMAVSVLMKHDVAKWCDFLVNEHEIWHIVLEHGSDALLRAIFDWYALSVRDFRAGNDEILRDLNLYDRGTVALWLVSVYGLNNGVKSDEEWLSSTLYT